MKTNRNLTITLRVALLVLMLALAGSVLTAKAAPKPVTDHAVPPAAQPKDQTGPTAATLGPLGSGFTYQGSLTNLTGNPLTGQYDLKFTLFDSFTLTLGTQVGSPIISTTTVTAGLFTVRLNDAGEFGATAFQGSKRWLELGVRPGGSGGTFDTLSPRQELTAAPYALSLMPGAVVTGTNSAVLTLNNTSSGTGVQGISTSGNGVYGTSTSGYGVQGFSTSNPGVYGSSSNSYGVYGVASSPGYAGVFGSSAGGSGVYGIGNSSGYAGVVGSSTSGYGVRGISTSNPGVYGSSTSHYGVEGTSTNNYGVVGTTGSSSYAGVLGQSTNSYGVYGYSNNSYGVYGTTTSSGNTGVYGYGTNGGGGVLGKSDNSHGVEGDSSTAPAVYGHNTGLGANGNRGVFGDSEADIGVQGISRGTCAVGNTCIGVYGVRGSGTGNWAGYFDGNVFVNGTLSGGAGAFKIDDPMDPANKYLYHSFVESPDMKNIYDGNVTTDANGNATVALPGYFETLNRDFRYQLTVIGQFAQAIVSSKIKDNVFTIKTDKPNVEVSWQVTGIRQDPYAEAHRNPVEQDKPADEKGYYLNPELYGQPASKNVNEDLRNPQSSPAGPANTPLPGGK